MKRQSNRPINRLENPNIDSSTCANVLLDKGSISHPWDKDELSTCVGA